MFHIVLDQHIGEDDERVLNMTQAFEQVWRPALTDAPNSPLAQYKKYAIRSHEPLTPYGADKLAQMLIATPRWHPSMRECVQLFPVYAQGEARHGTRVWSSKLTEERAIKVAEASLAAAVRAGEVPDGMKLWEVESSIAHNDPDPDVNDGEVVYAIRFSEVKSRRGWRILGFEEQAAESQTA